MPAPLYVYYQVTYAHCFGSLMHVDDNSFVFYGNKMVNDLFDGSQGFAIDGGIKDSKLVFRGSRITQLFLTRIIPVMSVA